MVSTHLIKYHYSPSPRFEDIVHVSIAIPLLQRTRDWVKLLYRCPWHEREVSRIASSHVVSLVKVRTRHRSTYLWNPHFVRICCKSTTDCWVPIRVQQG